MAELEARRWAKLSREQKADELRLREVRALERLAEAADKRNEIARKKFF